MFVFAAHSAVYHDAVAPAVEHDVGVFAQTIDHKPRDGEVVEGECLVGGFFHVCIAGRERLTLAPAGGLVNGLGAVLWFAVGGGVGCGGVEEVLALTLFLVGRLG